MAAETNRGVPLSTLCPKFLHTNSTSHTWPFSAIAELIDNAYDPDVCAKQFWIDKTVVKGEECLSFMDNGNGLNQEGMHKMLSFGYSDKVPVNGVAPIGIYGNGFKSGSMRLGKDAIVFSKSKTMSCVGMLSQTYLEKIKADQIIVPIVCFKQTDTQSVISVQEEHKASLQDILQFSPFETLEELNTELTAISSCSTEKTGTRIIIWNLRKTTAEKVEFDFESFRYDIRIPSDVYEGQADISYIPESVYSLRAYCSILYLKPRMQVIIRGQKVQTQLIAKSLASSRKDYYKPTFLLKRIPITLGYNPKSKDQYGVMMYHKNRLIKAYERVGCQLKANRLGVGVIAVIECNFLEPTHNKQSFNENDKYRKTMNNLAIKLEEYSKEICFTWNKTNQGSSTTLEDAMKRPDQNWVQCDDCLRWRKLPDGIDCSKLPDEWFCRMNPDPQFRSCQVEEEPEDSDDDQPSYCKTYKQQEKEEKRQQELKRQKEEEERKRQEAQHIAKLAKQNKTLKQILKKTGQSPSTPTTPKSRINTALPQGRAARPVSSSLRSSTISQAACSPSSSSSLPVISSVRSLTPSSGKRPQPVTPQMTPKRPRVNSPKRTISDKLSSVDASTSSPSLPAADDDDTNDDIFILEAESTPKPSKPMFDLNKVKTEPQSSGSSLLECRDDAAMDVALEANAAGPSSSAAVGTCTTLALPPHVTNITTQTEAPKLKKEEEPQSQNGWEERPGQSTSNENSTKQSSPVGTGVCSSDIKRESETGEAPALQNRASHLDNDDAGPSSSPPHQSSIIEAQKQQDQLLELMQATAQERDSFKEQVHELTTQLHEMQKRLEELSQLNVKKECSHLAVQTEQADGGIDYKSLFEKANSKIDELVKEKEALQAAAKTRPAIGESQERDIDEIALQVDHLIRELDERTSERNKLRLQMDTLTQEKMKLMANCEKLKLILREQQQQRETAQKARATSQRTTSVQTDTAETEVASTSGADSSPKINESLIQLRQNIGRLLITYVPALDLGQVNYECNVIDEILEQVLAGVDSSEAIGQMDDPQDY